MRTGGKGCMWDIQSNSPLKHPSMIRQDQEANLVYQNCCDVNFIELSSVSDEADVTANTTGAMNPVWFADQK